MIDKNEVERLIEEDEDFFLDLIDKISMYGSLPTVESDMDIEIGALNKVMRSSPELRGKIMDAVRGMAEENVMFSLPAAATNLQSAIMGMEDPATQVRAVQQLLTIHKCVVQGEPKEVDDDIDKLFKKVKIVDKTKEDS